MESATSLHHVWLPSLGVWAQAHRPSDGCIADDADDLVENSRTRSQGMPEPPSPSHSVFEDPFTRSRIVPVRAQSSRRMKALIHGDSHQTACSSVVSFGEPTQSPFQQEQTCPICLLPVDETSMAVLWWCMHKFCVHCIEKWSLMQRFCPLCKQTFHGWYYNIRSPSVFDKKALAAKAALPSSAHLNGLTGSTRIDRRPAQTFPATFRRSQALRRNRFFRSSRKLASADMERLAESIAAEEALKWRASIYKRGLRAVPLHVSSRVTVKQVSASDPERKGRIERRLEPWIRRELQAITEDSDPSLLVYFVLSLWFTVLTQREGETQIPCASHRSTSAHQPRTEETNCMVGTSSDGLGDAEAVRQLEPFLEERASAFWHELRCFAESPYTLKAYDSVAVYQKASQSRDSECLHRESSLCGSKGKGRHRLPCFESRRSKRYQRRLN